MQTPYNCLVVQRSMDVLIFAAISTRNIHLTLSLRVRLSEALAVAEGTDDRDIARVLADMETEMLAAADELQFERAANLRDQIEALRTGKPASPKRHKGRR